MRTLLTAALLALTLGLVSLGIVNPASAATLTWSGQTWDIRQDYDSQYPVPYGPGPNFFSGQGALVDAQGRLHLIVFQDSEGRWICPEIVSQRKFGFGEYKFNTINLVQNGQLVGIQKMDKSGVLGLFQYPTADLGCYGTHEMDIELSYWTNTAKQFPYFMNWSTYLTYVKSNPMIVTPEQQDWRGGVYPAGYSSNAPQTHSYYRMSNGILYSAKNAWTGETLASLRKTGMNRQTISQAAMPVHLNLWLEGMQAPSNGQPIEVVIQSFIFTPQR